MVRCELDGIARLGRLFELYRALLWRTGKVCIPAKGLCTWSVDFGMMIDIRVEGMESKKQLRSTWECAMID
jgi:hypothetical protein